MGVISPPKLEAFAQELAKGKTQHQAAIDAGYPLGSSIASNARRRAQTPKVRARVRELRERIAVSTVADQVYVQRRLMEISDTAIDPDDVRPSDIIQALKTLMDLNGLKAPEKYEHTLNDIGARLAAARRRAIAG